MIAMPSQFNELIQSQSIASITPQQILAAGEPVFLDIRTSADIASINKLIEAYGRIHTPTYGQPIPSSSTVTTVVGVEPILEPSTNEIRRVIAGSVTNNGGAAPIVGYLTLGGMLLAPFVANPSSTDKISDLQDIIVTKELALSVVVTSGDASDLSTSIASVAVVQ